MNLDFRSTQALAGARAYALAHVAAQAPDAQRDGDRRDDGTGTPRRWIATPKKADLAVPTPRHVIDAAERTTLPAV